MSLKKTSIYLRPDRIFQYIVVLSSTKTGNEEEDLLKFIFELEPLDNVE